MAGVNSLWSGIVQVLAVPLMIYYYNAKSDTIQTKAHTGVMVFLHLMFQQERGKTQS